MRFQGRVYRAHNPQWSWTPLSGEGARRHGGRFNRRGIPALYASLNPFTAIREAVPLGRRMQPLTLCAYEVDTEPVFNARNEYQRAALGVSDADLSCPYWEAEMLEGAVPSSQVLADRLIAAASLPFSPRGEVKCVRGPSGRGARRLARAGVLDRYVEHGKQAQRSPGGRMACFDRRVVRKAGYTGMLVRSFAVGAGVDDINLVLWKWGASRPSLVVLIDDESRLERRPQLT